MFASRGRFGSHPGMDTTWGERLRQRARELRLTDAEVARRLGLAQGRYSAYVNGTREPDLALFVRICTALRTTPDVVLGVTIPPKDSRPAVARLLAAAEGLDDDAVEMAAAMVAAMAAFRPSVVALGPAKTTASKKRTVSEQAGKGRPTKAGSSSRKATTG